MPLVLLVGLSGLSVFMGLVVFVVAGPMLVFVAITRHWPILWKCELLGAAFAAFMYVWLRW